MRQDLQYVHTVSCTEYYNGAGILFLMLILKNVFHRHTEMHIEPIGNAPCGQPAKMGAKKTTDNGHFYPSS